MGTQQGSIWRASLVALGIAVVILPALGTSLAAAADAKLRVGKAHRAALRFRAARCRHGEGLLHKARSRYRGDELRRQRQTAAGVSPPTRSISGSARGRSSLFVAKGNSDLGICRLRRPDGSAADRAARCRDQQPGRSQGQEDRRLDRRRPHRLGGASGIAPAGLGAGRHRRDAARHATRRRSRRCGPRISTACASTSPARTSSKTKAR